MLLLQPNPNVCDRGILPGADDDSWCQFLGTQESQSWVRVMTTGAVTALEHEPGGYAMFLHVLVGRILVLHCGGVDLASLEVFDPSSKEQPFNNWQATQLDPGSVL